MKGIYYIKINSKFYIGKDFYIDRNKRYREHIRLLSTNSHYNKYLQNAFNKYSDLEYDVLFKSDNIDSEQLCELEKKFIIEYDSFNNGYNLTLGGEGMSGFKFSEDSIKIRSERNIGEKNPQSKLSNEQFFEIVKLLKEGKTNGEIASLFNLNSGYISLIRHKRRFQKLWEQVDYYEPLNSMGNEKKGKIDDSLFIEIVNLIKGGKSNAYIERKFNLSSGSVSRIRNKKSHKIMWKKLFNE